MTDRHRICVVFASLPLNVVIGSNDVIALSNKLPTRPFRRLLRVMGGLTPEDRCQVPIRYKELYKKSLYDKIKSECGNSDVSNYSFAL
jgi:hypothetical protein